MRKLTCALIAALALAGALVSGHVARAQEEDFAGIQISPARFERDLSGRDFRIQVAVVNNDEVAHDLTLSLARLGHDLDGLPLFIYPSYIEDQVELSEDELRLSPGERADVLVEGSIPDDDRSLYPAVVAEFPVESGDSSVGVRARVAGFLLLRGPRPWDERIEVEDVSGLPPTQPGSRTVTLYAAARNVGNVHVQPRGFVEIIQDGDVLDRVRLSGDTIIPDFARRLTGSWTPPRGLTGTVELRAELANPAASGSGTLRLGPDLATAAIENLQATGEGGGRVSLAVVNTGTVAISPNVTFSVTEEGKPVASEELTEEAIEPGEAREVVWFARLDPGLYTATVRVEQDGRVLDESVVGFEVVSLGILRWIALALLAVVIGGHILRIRRRRRLF